MKVLKPLDKAQQNLGACVGDPDFNTKIVVAMFSELHQRLLVREREMLALIAKTRLKSCREFL
jgi:hypothetical protein